MHQLPTYIFSTLAYVKPDLDMGFSFTDKRPFGLFCRVYCTFILSLFVLFSVAQTAPLIETVHLKDGRTLIGLLTEIVVNEHLMIITQDGQEITMDLNDVRRISRGEGTISDSIKIHLGLLTPKEKREKPRWYYHRQKGYFFQWHLQVAQLQFGLHIVQGYKFGQFSYLGIGFGIDNVAKPATFWPKYHRDERDRTQGSYVPLFVHYSADLLNKRTTPFYLAEFGYVFSIGNGPATDKNGFQVSPTNSGGLYASTGFGVRFNTSRRFHTNVGLHLSLKNLNIIFRELHHDQDTGLYRLEYNNRSTVSLFFGITLIQGI